MEYLCKICHTQLKKLRERSGNQIMFECPNCKKTYWLSRAMGREDMLVEKNLPPRLQQLD